MSFENLTGSAGDLVFAEDDEPEGITFEEVVLDDPALAAMSTRDDWHFSCCFLNLFKLSSSDVAIYRQQLTISIQKSCGEKETNISHENNG